MTAKNILIGLIAITTIIFSSVFIASREIGLAISALAIGAVWFIQVTRMVDSSASLFFVAFLGLAIWGSLRIVSSPAILLAFSTDLAAWDLARFLERCTTRAMMGNKVSGSLDPLIEHRHLQRLGITLGVGLVLALFPVTIKLSVSFVVLTVVTLLTMFLLRQAIVYVRSAKQSGGQHFRN